MIFQHTVLYTSDEIIASSPLIAKIGLFLFRRTSFVTHQMTLPKVITITPTPYHSMLVTEYRDLQCIQPHDKDEVVEL